MLWLKKSTLIVAAFLALAAAGSWLALGLEWRGWAAAANIATFLRNDWLPPDMSVLRAAIRESLATVQIAFLSTLLALLISLPLSFLAAGNVAAPWVRSAVRAFLSFLRSVPEIVFGLLFVVAVGLGPQPAVIAILLHNVGVLGKLISELVEAADPAPQEALRAAGASPAMVALYGIVPQIGPNIVSQYFYRFEVAIRTSLILGFIGAGGIGQQLFMHFKIFKYAQVTVDVLVIMALVIAADALSAWVRRRMI